MNELQGIDKAREALEIATRFEDVVGIKNLSEQAIAFARIAKDPTLIERATEIRTRAMRKAGEMLASVKLSAGRPPKWSPSMTISVPKLEGIGVTKNQSWQWQRLAAISAENFEAAIAEAKTVKGEVTITFVLREAAKYAPPKEPDPSRKKRRLTAKARARRALAEFDATHPRKASMVCVYAPLLANAIQACDSFTTEESEAIEQVRRAIAEKLECEE